MVRVFDTASVSVDLFALITSCHNARAFRVCLIASGRDAILCFKGIDVSLSTLIVVAVFVGRADCIFVSAAPTFQSFVADLPAFAQKNIPAQSNKRSIVLFASVSDRPVSLSFPIIHSRDSFKTFVIPLSSFAHCTIPLIILTAGRVVNAPRPIDAIPDVTPRVFDPIPSSDDTAVAIFSTH